MTSVTTLHPVLQKQILTGRDAAGEVQAVAEYLANLMQGIHGGEWRININHDTCFVAVSRDFSNEGAAGR